MNGVKGGRGLSRLAHRKPPEGDSGLRCRVCSSVEELGPHVFRTEARGRPRFGIGLSFQGPRGPPAPNARWRPGDVTERPKDGGSRVDLQASGPDPVGLEEEERGARCRASRSLRRGPCTLLTRGQGCQRQGEGEVFFQPLQERLDPGGLGLSGGGRRTLLRDDFLSRSFFESPAFRVGAAEIAR